jgi:hypothetical protein|tara:strand:+ start:1256 stop:1582 length:327 start_codon:yes stop_codon:yes gene_type:complete
METDPLRDANQSPDDTPMHRKTITEMADNEIDTMLDGLRERRMKTVQVYQDAENAKAELKREKDTETLNKKLAVFKKKLDAAEKAQDALDAYSLKIRALRLELGIGEI